MNLLYIMRRNHIYLGSELLSNTCHLNSLKYCNPIIFKNVATFFDAMNEIDILKDVKYISNRAVDKNIKEFLDSMIAGGLPLDFKRSYEGDLTQILDAGIPSILINPCPCDFIEFDSEGYQFTCIQRDFYLREYGYYWNIENFCLKDDKENSIWNFAVGKKPCDQRKGNDQLLQILFIFYHRFSHVQVGNNDKIKGKMPIFFVTFFLDYVLFEYFFGSELFNSRYLRHKMSDEAFIDLLKDKFKF